MSLSYQHMYHAGNRADVHKHLWLVAVLDALRALPNPITWIDAHAGRGIYDLESDAAYKTKEATHGIKHLWDQSHLVDPTWIRLKQLQRKVNPARDGNPTLRYYAGSSVLAAMMMRPQDKLLCAELHPAEYAALRTTMKAYSNVALHHEDMVHLIHRTLPLHGTHGGMLIDPSYECKEEYATFAPLLHKIAKQWREGTLMLWYPILPAARHELLRAQCRELMPDIIIDEWLFPEPEQGVRRGLLGSGMIIARAPEQARFAMQAQTSERNNTP
ncbi:MAG: 23S rRNA (adenine(2030)-N(6))-methyltransferase RlmJ [Alphaproteobacteria bacterium]|nr:MAG: 23S rRNA (adenine(2030)-N(6))-methyltransferase RlmJ [Alphaproteobacteria bacterium]TAF38645.1 MAG: 23S rRNA (adenine(2030)-N(6))-methyltransferase RlmJ [Alphaproteobacteria bacterium]TAF75942.1 MAG: 23S rRNA (adenine(2030)-N(6))-methyltransferase RlmJ [Alphaproteobacteria bacterium]